MKVLATGGVYLAGGVAVHTLQAIKEPAFIEHFKRRGRFAELMDRIPIHVVSALQDWQARPPAGWRTPEEKPTIVNMPGLALGFGFIDSVQRAERFYERSRD